MKKIMNEKLAITTSNPVRARFYEYPRFTYPWHFHSEYEIIYVEKGEGDCLVGDSIIPYLEGDLILFGSELPHSMQSPPDSGEEADDGEKTELKSKRREYPVRERLHALFHLSIFPVYSHQESVGRCLQGN